MKSDISAALLSLGLIVPFSIYADGRPPKDAKPVSKLLAELEHQGFGPIVDVSFDNSNWEIEAYKGKDQRQIVIHPVTGAILNDRADDPDPKPPENAMLLSTVVQGIEQTANSTIVDVTFDDGRWDVDIIRVGQARELRVDPVTGIIVDDRAE